MNFNNSNNSNNSNNKKGKGTTYTDELTQYFRLKQKYEKKLDDEKQNIIKNKDLTPREKRQKYQQYKVRCINCSQSGGTIFSQKGNVYRAVCGNTETPCDLKIQITRIQKELMPELIQKYSHELEIIKSKIMKSKLDYIFEYDTEESSVQTFNILKKTLGEITDRYNEIYINYINIITNNENNDEVLSLIQKRQDTIQEFKSRINLYNNTGNIQYVVEATELYIRDITKFNNTIQQLEYSLYDVEFENDKYYLIREKLTNATLEVEVK